jgi:nucleoside-diphosphate-sugar epimerase
LKIEIAGDGSDEFDSTYIGDLVEGVRNVIEHDAAKGEIFNLTYGRARSLADLARILEQHFPAIQIEYLAKDALTPDRGTLSVEKARRLIGYQPSYTLEKGYSEYIEWYKHHFRARA